MTTVQEERFYHGELPCRPSQASNQAIEECVELVEDYLILPRCPENISLFPQEQLAENMFVKRPTFEGLLQPGRNRPLDQSHILKEIQLLELLRDYPHRNLKIYHGCIVRDGWITGLVLSKHDRTLSDVLIEMSENKLPSISLRQHWLRGVFAGMGHLHALGYAHNDINPMNVLIDAHGNAVLIDLDSCAKFGEVVDKWGTSGWEGPDACKSSEANDAFGLKRLTEELRVGEEDWSTFDVTAIDATDPINPV